MRQPAVTGPVMLNSWKEIASYLDRGVRTVQRWERELRLPVHRIGKGKRSPVYAITTELKLWIRTTEIPRKEKPAAQPNTIAKTGKPVEDSLRLLASVRTLAETVIQNSILQQKQAEILRNRMIRISELHERMKRA